MSNENMREAFNTWWKNGGHRMDCGGIEAGIVWDNAWQYATTATQRDAMSVAESVRKSMIDVAYNSQTPHGTITGEMESVDLAAIVEAVQPGKRESVNRQTLAALKRYDIEVEGTQIYRVGSPDGRYVLFDDVAAIAAAEAAQPASAQQQGEPVAWIKVMEDLLRDWHDGAVVQVYHGKPAAIDIATNRIAAARAMLAAAPKGGA